VRRAARLAGLGLPEAYLKVESAGPSGTLKDRIAPRLAAAAAAGGATEVTVGTCGNLGVALAHACRRRGLGCHVFVPARYRGSRCAELLALAVRVVAVDGSYEDAVDASRAFARTSGAFDASPGGPADPVTIDAYAALADEILRATPVPPASVWLPVGNGTAAAGLHLGFVRRGRNPAICVAGSAGNTALTASVRAGRVVELDPEALRETPTCEPLVNCRSLHAAAALRAVTESGGCAHDATDAELLHAARLLAAEGVAATPAGAAGVAGLVASKGRSDRAGPSVVVVTAGPP
jgi:threonine synthase